MFYFCHELFILQASRTKSSPKGHFVPGHERGESAKYKGKDLWPEVMRISQKACKLYFARVHCDFNRAVGRDSSAKVKAAAQSVKSDFVLLEFFLK